ncbi:MAG: tetratricopeptide repeat protein [Chitinophagaceae bacterium]
MEKVLAEKKIILFLASDPSNAPNLRLGKELQEVRNKLKGNSYFEIQDQQAVKPSDVLQTIITLKPVIVHFSGHGQENGELCFEDEQGISKAISPEALASLFSLVKDTVKCVIVSTCYSEKQAKAISQHVPVVIGTKKEISDDAAINFSTGFYTSLDPDLSQMSLNKAFELGRIAIQFDGNLQEHLKPILIQGSPEIRFASEVDTAFLSISQPKGLAVKTLIRGLTLTGKKFGLSEEVVKKIIDDKIQKLEAYSENITEYENSLKDILRDEFPLSEQALAALLHLQNGLGISNEAAEAVRNKIMSDPKLDSAYNWYDRGRGQDGLKNHEKAIEYYTKAIEKNNEYSGAYYGRGYSNQNLGKLDMAIEDFNKAIEYNKNWEVASSLNSAYFSRGLAYYDKQPQQNESVKMALKDWSQCIDINNTDPNAYWNRGLAHQFLRDFPKAIADFKKSVEIDNINSDSTKASRVTTLVKCYAEIGDQEEIKKWTKVGLDLLGKNAVIAGSDNGEDN